MIDYKMKSIPKKIVVATKNNGKVRELQELSKDLGITILSLNDFPGAPDVEENGQTFEENALKKAREIYRFTKTSALADDSGLCVDALDGRPGVFSARYAGIDVPDNLRYEKLLHELEGIPCSERTARFVCVLALVLAESDEIVIRSECHGVIIDEPRGSNGFGYDPVFLYEPKGLTFAEMDGDAKNRVSHRGKAMRELIEKLKSFG